MRTSHEAAGRAPRAGKRIDVRRAGLAPRLHGVMLIALFALVAGCASTPSRKIVQTDRAYDLAIDGEGYFIVETGHGGYLFTRKGDFVVDSQRYLATAEGYRIAPAIVLPENTHDLAVTLDGKIDAVTTARETSAVGVLRLAIFANPSRMERDGHYFLPTAGSGDPVTRQPGSGGAGTIRSRALEK